jgi:hypothetical protein
MILSRVIEYMAWGASAVGAFAFVAGAADVVAPSPKLALGLPPAADITAYGAAITGALVTFASGLLAIYQRYRSGRIEEAKLVAAKLVAAAKLEAARLRASRRKKPRKSKKALPKTDVDPTPKAVG